MPWARPRERMELTLVTDGASRGNPGPAAAAYRLLDDGEPIDESAETIGRATSNEAEYRALIAGLLAARDAGAATVRHVSDSQLLVRQMKGRYRVKAANLAKLHERVRDLVAAFEAVSHEHVRRSDPRVEAVDALANEALDRR